MSNSNTCFNCNTKIKDDSYGLTQCPSCHTPIFIDFEGHVQKPLEEQAANEQNISNDLDEPQKSSDLSSAEFEPQAEVKDQGKTTNELENLEAPSKDDFFQEALNPDLFSEEQKPSSDFDIPQNNLFTDAPLEETINPTEKNDLENSQSNNDTHHDNFDTQKTNDKNLQDVIDYGNSSDNLDLGGFYYNIVISGIDSRSLRQSVLDALDDSRLGWKKEEMDVLIKNGQLTIEKINAAKTYILISYLKFLPIRVKWDQISVTKS